MYLKAGAKPSSRWSCIKSPLFSVPTDRPDNLDEKKHRIPSPVLLFISSVFHGHKKSLPQSKDLRTDLFFLFTGRFHQFGEGSRIADGQFTEHLTVYFYPRIWSDPQSKYCRSFRSDGLPH